MIMIWNRLGWLVPVIGLLGMVVVQLVVNLIFGMNAYKHNIHYQNAAIAIVGGLVFIVGNYLNHSCKIEIRCKQTEQLLEIKDKHTFFYIPFERCGLIISLFSLLKINN